MQDISAYFGPITGFISAAVGYGILRGTVSRIEQDISRVWEAFDKHVTLKHFEGVIQAIQADQAEMKRDIKEILAVLSKRE